MGLIAYGEEGEILPANNVAVTPQAAPRLRVFPVLACLALGLLLGVVAK
jgi:hypothetical protein